MRIGFAILLSLLSVPLLWAGHPFQVEDMQKLMRIGEAQLSPDGKWIAFSVGKSDVAKNKMVRNLFMIPSAGGPLQQLTFADKGSNTRPLWSTDGKYLYFLSTRASDVPQIFRLPVGGGEAIQVSKVGIGVDSYIVSPDSKTIAFTSTVYPECADVACNEKKSKEVEDNPVKARIITSVPMRRWDTWIEGKRNHIFVMPADGGDAKDITPGDIDSPIWSEGGGEEVAFSPDSAEICFSRQTQNETFVGNTDLFTVPATGGAATAITTNKAGDTTPLYSPDGQYIAYTATLRPDQESDLSRLFLYNRKTRETKNVTEPLDRPIGSYNWSSDSKTLWITIDDQGQSPILKMDVATGATTKIYSDGANGDIQISSDGKFLVFSHQDISHPNDIYRIELASKSKDKTTAAKQLTTINSEILKDIDFGEYSSFTFPGWNGETVQSWQIKPPSFDPSKKYPLLLLMHGGPESSWANNFHFRWNAHLFAAAGYVVIEPNFHGSSGFGLKFMDAIKGQWGGAPYEDQMKAVDLALTWPYVDTTRVSAAGASYGGYMAAWVEGHTDRFRCIVNHDGLYDLLTALYASDFAGGIDKEFKGTPWENQQALIDQAPVTYAKNFKTPMLVVHGDKDYRVDPGGGYAMFQLLQAMKIPSKFLSLPDENHWVLHPANSILWYHTVLDWINQWMKPDTEEYKKMVADAKAKPY